MSDDESEVSEYDRYSLTESSEPIDALESLDREIERLNEEIARRRRQNPNGSRGAPADERAELGGVRSRLASLKKERLVVGFRQEYPAIPAEKVKLIETAKGSPDILAVSTDDHGYVKAAELWYINGGFYRARTTRPETDDEIRARADDIVGDMVEDIGRSGFRPSVGKLLALREKIEQHSYARSIDYNGWWDKAAADMPLWNDVLREVTDPIKHRMRVQQAPPLATTTSIAVHGPVSIKVDGDQIWVPRECGEDLTDEIARVIGNLGRRIVELKLEAAAAAPADSPAEDDVDDGYGTEDEEPPDELAQLRKEKAVLEKRLERARREVTLGNTTKQPSRVLNVSYRRHDGNAPSESDAHIPSAGPLFGRKLPQQRALPLRPQNRTGVAADGKRSPARRRARRRGTGQGASEEQENKSIEERLLSPIAGLLAQLHSGALDPLQLSPEWRPPLIAYLRHILGDEWRCRSDAASFRLGPFKETADDVLQKLGGRLGKPESTAHWDSKRWWSEIKAARKSTADELVQARRIVPPTAMQTRELRKLLHEKRDWLVQSGVWPGHTARAADFPNSRRGKSCVFLHGWIAHLGKLDG